MENKEEPQQEGKDAKIVLEENPKISFKTPQEWSVFKDALEPFIKELK